MIGSIVMGIIGYFKKANEAQDKLNEKMADQLKMQKELNIELERMNEVRGKGLVKEGLDTSIQFGNMISSADMAGSLAKAKKFRQETTKKYLTIQDQVSEVHLGILDNEALSMKKKNMAYLEKQDERYNKMLDHSTGRAKDRILRLQSFNDEAMKQREKEIDQLSELGFANKDLQLNYKSNIETLKQLEQGAVGPLKDTYKEMRIELEKNGSLSDNQIKRLGEEERAYVSLTERVKRYGEVSKSFQQALAGMAGKGLPMQNQRKALNDMLLTQEALIKKTRMGLNNTLVGPRTKQGMEDRAKAEITLTEDELHLTELQKFQKQLNGIVTAEKAILSTQQENARTFLEHANARTIADKKAKIAATGMLKVDEKLARAKQDQANAEAALKALQLKG